MHTGETTSISPLSCVSGTFSQDLSTELSDGDECPPANDVFESERGRLIYLLLLLVPNQAVWVISSAARWWTRLWKVQRWLMNGQEEIRLLSRQEKLKRICVDSRHILDKSKQDGHQSHRDSLVRLAKIRKQIVIRVLLFISFSCDDAFRQRAPSYSMLLASVTHRVTKQLLSQDDELNRILFFCYLVSVNKVLFTWYRKRETRIHT